MRSIVKKRINVESLAKKTNPLLYLLGDDIKRWSMYS